MSLAASPLLFSLLLRKPTEPEPLRLARSGSFVSIDGVRLHYAHSGSGPALILLHGFGAWNYSWRKNIPTLSEKFAVYAPDLKGFGLSDKPAGGNYSVDAQAALISSFMDKLSIREAVIVGNSLGGAVALRLYANHPEKVKGLVLVDSAGYQEAPSDLLNRIPKPVRPLILNNLVLTKWLVEAELVDCYADPNKVTDEVVNNYFLPLKTNGIENSALGLWNDLRLSDESETIRTVRVPTLIVWGEMDRILPVDLAFRFHSDISNSRLVVIPGAGHACPEEAPARVNEAIKDFASAL